MVLHCYHHENSPSIRHGSLLERAMPVESFQCEKIALAGDHSPGANFLAAREMVATKKEPATPLLMAEILHQSIWRIYHESFTGFYLSQVVRDFSHQQ